MIYILASKYSLLNIRFQHISEYQFGNNAVILSSFLGSNTHIYCFFFPAVSSVYPLDFCLGLCLHDRRVLLGSSVWVPGRQQHHSHRRPGVPTGLQVEETPCGQEDAGWVRHLCSLIASFSICSGTAGEAFVTFCYEIHVRIPAGACLHSQRDGLEQGVDQMFDTNLTAFDL